MKRVPRGAESLLCQGEQVQRVLRGAKCRVCLGVQSALVAQGCRVQIGWPIYILIGHLTSEGASSDAFEVIRILYRGLAYTLSF